MEIKGEDNPTFKEMSFPLKDIVSIKFMGEDKDENIYIKTEHENENQVLVVEVHKFNSDGDYLNTINMPESNIRFWSVRNYAVNKDGTIYQFLPEKNRLILNILPDENH